ncbi:hypothetical protein [Tessaracoccus terricola]
MSSMPEVITPATDAEATAALVALLARAVGTSTEIQAGATAWNSHHRQLRVPPPRGRDTWRDSLRTP